MDPSRKEHDMIVDRAGMASKFPGHSETCERFKEFDPSVYTASKFTNSISKSAIQNHQLRVKKHQNPENYKVTGQTETAQQFVPNAPEDYMRVVVTRSDQAHSKIIQPSKFEGNTEYTVIYSRLNECLPKKESPLTINPYKNIDSASRGRRNEENNMFTPESLSQNYITHTKLMHQWPVPEDRRRFDWMQNKHV